MKHFTEYHLDLQTIVELTRSRGWVHLNMPRVALYNGDLAYGFAGMYPCKGPSFTFDQWHKCTEAHKNRFYPKSKKPAESTDTQPNTHT